MAKTILRKTPQKVAIKVSGNNVVETINLSNADMVHSTEVVDGTPKVNILGLTWSGAPSSTIVIKRNNVVIMSIAADQPSQFDFENTEFVDSIENTSNIEVTTTGEAALYLLLRKQHGYSSKIETAQFSVYDDVNAVGH